MLDDVRRGDPRFGVMVACVCKNAEKAAKAHARQQQRLAELVNVFGVEFQDATFANFAVETRRYPAPAVWYELTSKPGAKDDVMREYPVAFQRESLLRARARVQAYAADPHGALLLIGNFGTGKTHLAVAAAREIALRGHTVAHDTLSELLEYIRRGFHTNSASQRLADLQDVDLLIFDDVGSLNETDWAAEKVDMIINSRYVRQKWTIFTSDLPIHMLRGRIASRIAGFASIVPMIAFDHRLLERT